MNESTSYLVILLRYTERIYVVRMFQYFKKITCKYKCRSSRFLTKIYIIYKTKLFFEGLL